MEALRSAGAPRLDPVRWRYLELLAQRMEGQPEAVRSRLQERLAQGLEAMRERVAQAQPAAPVAKARGTRIAPPLRPLAQLNAYIAAATKEAPEGQPGGEGDASPEIRSVRRFRETWSKIDAERQVDQAVVRAPENAGPLNSHTLVLRSLGLMRDLSPDYLRRFLVHVDALLWLSQAEPGGAAAEGKGGRRARGRK